MTVVYYNYYNVIPTEDAEGDAAAKKAAEKAAEEAQKEAEEEAEKLEKERKAQKKEALERAVDIAPKIREELGQTWLDESFTARPRRGMEILSVIGSAAANGLFAQAHDIERRFKSLELQTTAAEALLAAAPERATEWEETLNLLANNWLVEASFAYRYDTSTQRGPSVRRDAFGNVYYNNFSSRSSNRNIPKAIASDELLEIRAGSWEWERVDQWRQSLHERFDAAFSASTLPERPDYATVNDYLVRARRDEFGSAT